MFATADGDTSVRIYDRNGKLKATYSDLLLEPFAISFMPDGKQVVIGGADCTLTILDASDAHVVRRLPKQPDPIFAVAALPDGVSLLSVHIDAARLDDSRPCCGTSKPASDANSISIPLTSWVVEQPRVAKRYSSPPIPIPLYQLGRFQNELSAQIISRRMRMKYMINWFERSQGSPMEYENTHEKL